MLNSKYLRVLILVSAILVVIGLMGNSIPAVANRAADSNPEKIAMIDADVVSYFPLVSRGIDEPGPFGVQYYYDAMNPEADGQTISRIGASWARNDFSWKSAERNRNEPPVYDWSKIDPDVWYARELGMQLIFNINIPPDWATDPVTGRIKVDCHDEFAQFMAALVERYDGDGYADAPGSPIVRYFEIINEPDAVNASKLWSNYGYAVDEYAHLLKTIYPAMKAASSKAQIVMGGVAMDWFVEEDANGHFARDFVENLFKACQGQQCFDVVNFHAYPEHEGYWLQYGKALYGKGIYMRMLMDAYGIGDYPLMVTETSWGSRECEEGSTCNYGYGGDQAQSRFVVKLFTRGMALDMDAVIWFKSNDTQIWLRPGLLNEFSEPKPSYYTLETLISQLLGSEFERPLTVADTGFSDIEGYRFKNAHNGRTDVLWVQDTAYKYFEDEPSYSIRLQAALITVYTIDGSNYVVRDADDGSTDGRVTLTLDCDPLIVVYED